MTQELDLLTPYQLSMLAYEARRSPLGPAILSLINEVRSRRRWAGEDAFVPIGYRVHIDRDWYMEHRGDDHWSRGFSI